MKLRELFETRKAPQSIGVCFGRWNPPHKGHAAAWEIASQSGTFYVGTNHNTQGPNDPLPYDVKLKCMEAIWPDVAGHVIPEQSLFTLAAKVYAKHGENVHLKVATDEDWLTSSLAKYNGKEGAHGFYKFASITHSPTPRLSSATALRAAVRAGNREAFTDAAGVPADTPIQIGNKSVAFFDVVSHFLKEFPEKVKKGTKVSEAKGGMQKIDPTQKAAMKNAMTMPALNMAHGSAYTGYRFGIALAGAPDYPTKMAADNWIGGDPLLSTYTDEEMDMVQKAMLKVGGGKIENWSGKRSQEIPGINTTSAVAKIKKNKYGI